METSISRHNSKVLSEEMQAPQPHRCKCDGGPVCCPVEGKCHQTGVVYRASVKERTSGKIETYTGLTGRRFIDRWKEHDKDFDEPNNRTSTTLSSHVWSLKDQGLTEGLNFDITWKILDRGPSFNPVSRKCILCLKEKFFIMYHPESSSLNRRSEVFNTCRHRLQGLLSKVK